MLIDLEYLTAMKESAVNQQRSLLAQAQQAAGAIVAIDAMIERFNQPEDEGEAK